MLSLKGDKLFSQQYFALFVIYAAKNFENRLTKKLCSKLSMTREFALAREIIQDHKLSILAKFLT